MPAHFEGELSQDAVVHALRGIFLGRLTGLLHFARAEERLSLRFVFGQVVSASSGAVSTRLGQILVRIGLLESDDLELALSKARDAERALGPVLVETGLVRREHVQEALRLQVREVLLTALFWGAGSFRFEPDEGAMGAREEISLRLPTAQILFEVVGAMTDEDAVRKALGDVERSVAAVKDPPVRIERVTLSPGDGYVVSTGSIPGGVHSGDQGASVYAFFSVPDLDAALARVRELGGEGRWLEDSEDSVTEFGRFALCKDDQGSGFGLHQPPPG